MTLMDYVAIGAGVFTAGVLGFLVFIYSLRSWN